MTMHSSSDLYRTALRNSGFTWAVAAFLFSPSDFYIHIATVITTIVFFLWSVIFLPFKTYLSFDNAGPDDLWVIFKRFQIAFAIVVFTAVIVHSTLAYGIGLDRFWSKLATSASIYVVLLVWTLRYPPGDTPAMKPRHIANSWE